MKKQLFLSTLLTVIGAIAFAQQPKRDVRATWLSTVWALDWPSTTVPAATGANETARENARNTQKNGLISILNKLEAANFNTVFFQVRGMSDAFYNSQYEPWSQYLSSERGADPGWDPLAYIVEEAHKRGIEVHAWLNPYRYSTAAASHGNLPSDYAQAHPDWLLDYGNYTKILNPGMPEVRQRICDVVADIIEHYDVDGIVFDDYFYVEGITDAMDNAQFQAYNPSGLSRADWRRSMVNLMVREVQAKINSIKPEITFGISPAGVSASSASHAAKYGIDPAPAGSDWQYSGIYSDPIAWLNEGSIDYISPQIYWAIGSSSDYAKLSPWWAKVANKFGRHFYSSNTSSYSNASTELPAEVNVNLNADLNGTTGAVFFRTNNLATTALNALKAGVYQNRALRAAYGWKPAHIEGLVTDIALSGQILTWNYNAASNVRFSIYAIPNANRNDADAFSSPKYLQGVSYTRSFTLSSGISAATHKIAVAVYDRFGNEFPPRVMGETAATVDPAQLTYPADNAQDVVLPALFSWQPNSADYYIWELAEDAAFTKPVASRETSVAEFNSGLQTNIKENTTYYWRVKSIAANAPVSTSAVWSFNGLKFRITSPADGATNVSLSPTIAWTNIGEGANYTLEVSSQSSFASLEYSADVQTLSATVPEGALATATTYYARVKATLGSVQAISERVTFKTEERDIPIPLIASPTNGATLYGSSIELCWNEQYSKGFRAELSADSSFPTRYTTVKSTAWNVYCATFTNLQPGTWYLRVKANNSTGLTDPSAYITVNLSATGIEQPDNQMIAYYSEGLLYFSDCESKIGEKIEVFNLAGQLQLYGFVSQSTTINVSSLPKGIYIVKTGNFRKKFVKN
jgi:uncharacterized lipoprotein YddW (UPF0748 family)